MSSRTAAWGQPPVSMARIRLGARALWRVRNSASSLFVVGVVRFYVSFVLILGYFRFSVVSPGRVGIGGSSKVGFYRKVQL
jgi:hypothetical protein